jgi:ferredoxin
MAGVQSGFPDGLAKTPFIAEVDPQHCDYCGECLRACNVKCIGLDSDVRAKARAGLGGKTRAKRYAEVNRDLCLGCGVCVSRCERGAISLVKRRRYRTPPRDPVGLFARILWEKGRLMPFIAEGLKRRWRLPPLRRR